MNTSSTLALKNETKTVNFKKYLLRGCIAGLFLLPLVWMDLQTYLTLMVAGLSLGMLIFLIASGLTLIFGLMDVLNLAHAAFFAFGAYAGYSILNLLNPLGWVETGSFLQSIISLGLALLVAALVGGILGFITEKLVIKKVYGDHLMQILVTVGVSFVIVEILKIIWGVNDEVVPMPMGFSGSSIVFGVFIEHFRVVAIVIGLMVYAGLQLILKKTKIGIIVRAGVENQEIVQATGYNISLIFTLIFAAGAALAAVGGTMMGIFNQAVDPYMGDQFLIFALIVVIIGGMGSVTGSFVGAIIVGLAFNYFAYLAPKLALGVNFMIMAIILLIRPKGLFGKD
ncbi:MAG: branched-chain amino acid ABC transporter permease [Desulfobacteraceae bacterium]|nr:branched-chain amino acid ABC transporter permease [Desulfobacteraceae bacterium]